VLIELQEHSILASVTHRRKGDDHIFFPHRCPSRITEWVMWPFSGLTTNSSTWPTWPSVASTRVPRRTSSSPRGIC
jgi:hypothetical protein